jgi:excisionase family DNA binding protein
MDADGLRDVAEAAKWLNIGKSTLQRLVTAHAVPCRRIGRLVRFSQEDLDEIVASRKQPVMALPTRAQIIAIRADKNRPNNPPPQKTNPPPAGPKTEPPPAGPKRQSGKSGQAA